MKWKKKNIVATVCCIAVVLVIAAWWLNKPRSGEPMVSTGHLERYVNFQSKYVEPRTVSVWLPDGYTEGDTCDVVYMHDGQMLFDATTTWNHQEWQVDEVVGRMIAQDSIRKCIVVGIDNTEKRLNEYYPAKTCLYVPLEEREGKELKDFMGDDYLRFLVEEVKPFIDNHYKPLTSREHTFLMGSSMGGLISLYGLCEYPQVFGGAACLSSHLSMSHLPISDPEVWGDSDVWFNAFCEYLRNHLPEANSCLVYMDHGTKDIDADYGPYQEKVDKVFRQKGWDDEHFQTLVYEGHRHREEDWAKRLNIPFYFLLHKTMLFSW